MSTYTTDDFKKIIKELYPNITMLSEWHGAKTKIRCRCDIDGYEWEVYSRTIKERGCPKCNGSRTRKWSDEEYKAELNRVHDGSIVALETYVNMNTKILHRCNIHNYEYYAKPAHVVKRIQGCKYCALKKIGDTHRDTLMNVKNKIFHTCGNEFELLENEYKNNSTKMLFKHNMPDGTSHLFYSSANAILCGQGCGACHGMQVSVGYNDIATTNPYVASLLENKNDAYHYTQYSGSSVNFKCPNCGHIKKSKISYVSRNNELSCPICGDGYSYPNKFMYHCLSQIKTQLDFLCREYSPDWCKFRFHGKEKTGKYDIYFSVNGTPIICELDGGIGHGNKVIDISKEDSLYIDKEKDRVAIEHGIQIIRINCNYERRSRYEFIKENILKSELSNIIDMSSIDFEKANVEAQSSMLIKCCQLWDLGFSSQQIAEQIEVVGSTVTNYLKAGMKYGLCHNYSSQESMYRSHSREVICLTTKKNSARLWTVQIIMGLIHLM